MIDFDRCKRLANIMSLLNQESHTEKCKRNIIGDGIGNCACGLSKIKDGLELLLEEALGRIDL